MENTPGTYEGRLVRFWQSARGAREVFIGCCLDIAPVFPDLALGDFAPPACDALGNGSYIARFRADANGRTALKRLHDYQDDNENHQQRRDLVQDPVEPRRLVVPVLGKGSHAADEI